MRRCSQHNESWRKQHERKQSTRCLVVWVERRKLLETWDLTKWCDVALRKQLTRPVYGMVFWYPTIVWYMVPGTVVPATPRETEVACMDWDMELSASTTIHFLIYILCVIRLILSPPQIHTKKVKIQYTTEIYWSCPLENVPKFPYSSLLSLIILIDNSKFLSLK